MATVSKTNAVARGVLMFDTVKALLIAFIFTVVGVGVAVVGRSSDNPGPAVAFGSLFAVVGVVVAVYQYVQLRMVRSGPPGTATRWLADRELAQMRSLSRHAQMRSYRRRRSMPPLVKIKF